MLTVICPTCQATLSLDPNCAGTHVACGACGACIHIVAPTGVAAPSQPDIAPLLDIPSSTFRRPRKKKSGLGGLLNLAVHLTIPAVTLYLGYRFILRRPASDAADHQVATRPRVSKQITNTPAKPHAPSPLSQPQGNNNRVERPRVPPSVSPPAAIEPAIEVDQTRLAALPSFLDLPPSTAVDIVTLARDMRGVQLRFLPSSGSLTFEAEALRWKPSSGGKIATVAGVRITKEGTLDFRWMRNVSADGEAAIRNSVIQLSDEGYVRHVALRSPETAQPFSIDLNKSLQKVVGTYQFPPNYRDVRVTLTGVGMLPPHEVDGCAVDAMKVGDQTFLRYASVPRAATRITVQKSGRAIAVLFDTRFVLPSGDEEPMSISRGNRKLRDLKNLIDEAANAQRSIGNLRNLQGNIESSIRSAARASTGANVNGVWVENPIAVGQKNRAIARLQDELAITIQQIERAEGLIADRPAMTEELAALETYATFARQLHGTKGIGFRFFTIVDGQEVNLLVAE